ncbi:fimbrial biogenesis outer membrane usher protein [Caballeronia concitans]|uniref:Fimbrial biogenesis outer membrane usher protein n=2 Tax=Caballeronia concitans TaxID=1777133 RepID=A0A658QWS4_9BURK|nr:fimbrial biogenesis outer membrane usher protein [Burkholderia sp. MR1]SAL28806.1 fimbrial biogenesis outer membrane usher protein [Caballeronia concitans]
MNPAASLAMFAFATLGGMHVGAVRAADVASGSANVEFDTTFLRLDAKERQDVSRFSRGNTIKPGTYDVDIWINDGRVAREPVRFVTPPEGGNARACLTRAALQGYVDFAKVAADPHDEGDACLDVSAAIPGASADFDFGEQKLSLSIPQIYVRNTARGYVPPEQWDEGVNAGFLSYNANAYRSNNGGVSSTQEYLGISAGVNIGGWHFRHQSSVTAATRQATQFDDIATYVQHDLPKLRAQVTLGDARTTGDVFDSVQFRGAQVATDDRMLPESLRGYAPVVRGTAESNARVTVRQNGQVIYETSVPPGPFELRDLYATGYGGNLDVTVTEADGRMRQFSVPYASIAQLLRPGTTRFAVTAGQLRDEALDTQPGFVQLTIQRGLTNLVTLYGGAVASTGYVAANLGAALNTKLGALAADITTARTDVPDGQTLSGHSLHIGYSKVFSPTDTNISLGAYRFSDANYLGLADAARLRDDAMHGGILAQPDRQRGRFQLTVNQSLGTHGSFFATVSSQSYWNRPGHDTFYQAGYSNSFKYGTYSVSAGRTRNGDGKFSDQFMVSTTIPLGHSQHAPMLSANFNSNDGAASLQTSIGGTAGDRDQYSYNVYGTAAKNDHADANLNGGASGIYRGAHAQVSASASGGAHSSQMSAGVSGSIVAHPGGITLAQTVGDTFGIVEAKGAEGASVSGAQGVEVDKRGYAVVPYLTPYGMNTVDLDPKGTSADVELESTSEHTAPHLGSIVMLKYKTTTGRAALIRAPLDGGEPLPFGAEVVDANGRNVGVVAQDSRVFARGIEDSGTLVAKWGDERSQQCAIAYTLPKKDASGDASPIYASVESHCRVAITTAGDLH